MSILNVWHDGGCTRLQFEGEQLLSCVLREAGIFLDHPCGARGRCGKCKVRAEGNLSPMNAMEMQAGSRLSCQIVLYGNASVWIADQKTGNIEISGAVPQKADGNASGYGCAIDIGTTTLVAKLYDLESGTELCAQSRINPQRMAGADVMSRIDAAMHGQGEHLQRMITKALDSMIADACAETGIARKDVQTAVVTGNTAMLYLLNGRNPGSLSRAPFEADMLFDVYDHWLGMPVYYPGCMNAFVGADITCAVLASGMCMEDAVALLCDIGTNGEIALWKKGKLYVTSTAAGPAFEGAGISCGCGSVPGAVDRAWVEDGKLRIHTIGNLPPVGICGSGLIDCIAAFLEIGQIDETGAMDGAFLAVWDGISLRRADVRAVQLAKAAIAAGISTLLETTDTGEDEISALYIAGGFGSHLNVESAADIGLIPRSLSEKVKIIGNAALAGAAQILLRPDAVNLAKMIVSKSAHVNLGGNPVFNMHYMEQMIFGDGNLFE